ncbi:hypothetical protein K503DRAFT_870878 [Rhizopogon vinicolor AM-OR11-026]|uniref:Uncharacterized protein n=1 Tax=Rhizopogon vinicolor AM-OR11-026 TaxID=1314800 RepID=A0A1B7MDW7_9AGAM|nr:hypothetical protein K503DRAFT_870878 [Rhizopogon vinicolor AM-OR11-026]
MSILPPCLILNRKFRGNIVSQDTKAVDHTIDYAAGNVLAKRRRLVIVTWDPKHLFWKSYGRSHVEPIVPREDLYNYFYLDVPTQMSKTHET